MMTSSNGNIFRVTGPLHGELNGHRWIPVTKASDVIFLMPIHYQNQYLYIINKKTPKKQDDSILQDFYEFGCF